MRDYSFDLSLFLHFPFFIFSLFRALPHTLRRFISHTPAAWIVMLTPGKTADQ